MIQRAKGVNNFTDQIPMFERNFNFFFVDLHQEIKIEKENNLRQNPSNWSKFKEVVEYFSTKSNQTGKNI